MNRPRIKPEHTPYKSVDGHVRIGGGVFGISAEIEDPAGWIWSVVTACDGSRDTNQVVDAVRADHPSLAPQEIIDALEKLIAEGYVEDVAGPVPSSLSSSEIERYGRSAQYYRWTDLRPRSSQWEVQERLKRSRVVVVGVGGAGGAAAMSLAASGVGSLHCVDHDIVELSNLNRQTLYRESDIGKPKVEAAIQHLRRLNSDITVSGQRMRITREEDFAPLLEGRDLLVLGADNPVGIRVWANRACLATGTPSVDGGYRGPLITAGGYLPGEGACWECLRLAEDRRRDLRETSAEDKLKALPRAPGHPVTAVTAGLSGQLMAHWAIALLTGSVSITPGSVWGLNLMDPGTPVMECFPAQPDCPACGQRLWRAPPAVRSTRSTAVQSLSSMSW